MKYNRGILALFLMSLANISYPQISIEDAYEDISHRRTVFSPMQSGLAPLQAKPLGELFDLIEQGFAIRIDAWRALETNNSERLAKAIEDYNSLIKQMLALNADGELNLIRNDILFAIRLHQNFYNTRLDDYRLTQKFDQRFTQDVQQASAKLRNAYGMLATLLKGSEAKNKVAFYNALCALDFI